MLKPREERIANDAYFTPPPLAEAICVRLAGLLPRQDAIWDPCCGDLAFVNAALEEFPAAHNVTGTDLPHNDFLKDLPPRSDWSLIVSNPPYLLAEQFVAHARSLIRYGGHVAFLLRLSFLCGQKRVESLWSRGGLRYLLPIAPRPSFTPDGKTDASEYGVFVWERGHEGPAEILPHIRWKR